MTTLTASPAPPGPALAPLPDTTRPALDAARIVVHGDFACPWSHLASRRADRLAAAGVVVDWRAVEHEPRRPWRADPAARLEALRAELPAVLGELLPGETLPGAAGRVAPWSRAATAAYAEAYAAGVAPAVRRRLFEAYWEHGFDLDDADGLRALLRDLVRGADSPSEVVREWGHVPDVSGGPVSTAAWRLLRDWREEWRPHAVVPTLTVDGVGTLTGVAAVRWLGDAARLRGLDAGDPVAPRRAPGHVRPADLSWVSRLGEPFHPEQQRRAARLPWEHEPDGA